jgi:hypothetical protein
VDCPYKLAHVFIIRSPFHFFKVGLIPTVCSSVCSSPMLFLHELPGEAPPVDPTVFNLFDTFYTGSHVAISVLLLQDLASISPLLGCRGLVVSLFLFQQPDTFFTNDVLCSVDFTSFCLPACSSNLFASALECFYYGINRLICSLHFSASGLRRLMCSLH